MSHKRIVEERWQPPSKKRALRFLLSSREASKPYQQDLLRFAGFFGVLMICESVGQEVAAMVKRSQQRRHRIADEQDFERLMASDPRFARDLDISSKRKLSWLL